MHFISKKSLSLFIIINYLLTGCVPMIACSGIGVGGYAIMRDKSVGNSITDTKIESLIKSRLYKIDPELYSNVSVSVDNGCVLLTGAVNNTEWVSIAERESWKVEGVVVVDNNIIAGKTLDLSTIINDGAITSKVRAKLLCCRDIKSVNYKIKTMDGVVYIRGVARSQEELNTVLGTVQHLRGIKKIVSYITVAQNK